MGITGLLPFLKRSTRPASVREFSGGTAAVDAYSWLHKGAFACADRLARGEPTDVHIRYCLKYANLLLAHGVKPVLVFDGRHLPSKEDTEAKRRESRRKHRALAAEHLRAGRDRQARECFQRCVDVTPAMAHQLIVECRRLGVDCMVAPYEADAQLAYLARNGIADLVITEDSDLVLFGCPNILFKMDAAGSGRLIEAHALPLSLGASADKFSLERLRLVCILSGCDYAASLPGVGLGKASRLLVRAADAADTDAVLDKLPAHLGMRSLSVSAEYKRAVRRAEETFLYQLVFDPVSRRLVPLTPYPAGRSAAHFPFAGAWIGHEAAFQQALGNIDVSTGVAVDDFNPDRPGALPAHAPHKSIWARDYVPARRARPAAGSALSRASTAGKTARLSMLENFKRAAAAAAAAVTGGRDSADERRRAEADVAALYAAPPAAPAAGGHQSALPDGGPASQDSGVASQADAGDSPPDAALSPDDQARSRLAPAPGPAEDSQSPELGRRPRNPFRVRGRLRERLGDAVRRRVLAGGDGLTKIVTSKYFPAPEPPQPPPEAGRAPVQSMEELLKRRRNASGSPSLPSPKRAHLDRSSPPPPPRESAGDSWYKMSSVFDPKHAMTVWDSEVHGLRRPVTPRSPGKENSPTKRAAAEQGAATGRSPTVCAPKRFLGLSGPVGGRSAPAAPSQRPGEPRAAAGRTTPGTCRKLGLAKPAAVRQLNLKQMFAFHKSEAPKLKH